MSTQTATNDFMKVPEAAKLLKMGSRPLYRAIRNGTLRAVSINDRGDLRLTSHWLTAWVESRVVRADVDGVR